MLLFTTIIDRLSVFEKVTQFWMEMSVPLMDLLKHEKAKVFSDYSSS